MGQLSHLCMTIGKTIALTVQNFVGKVTSLLLNTLSRFFIAFLPRSKCLLISWLQSPSIVISEPTKIKSVTVSTFPLSICYEVMALDAMTLVFWMLSFKPAFSLSFFNFIKRLLFSLHFLPLKWYHRMSEVVDISPSSLDSRLWVIQPGISHDVLCMEVK